MAAKYIEITSILSKRLQEGVYTLKPFPSERELTEEFHLSRNTVRKIIDRLVEAKLLVKTPHRGVEVIQQNDKLNIAYLAPAIYSESLERLRFSLEHAVSDKAISLHCVDYVNWNDPVVSDVLKNFDGVFIVPMTEDIPKNTLKAFSEAKASVVMFERDLREYGIPSIITTPHFFVQHLMDHLAAMGHQHIDCFNTQNLDDIILGRIQQWQVWNSTHGGRGKLYQDPVERYGSPTQKAYHITKRVLEQPLQSSAIICLTEPCAIGVTKALWEHGLEPGKDISLATFESSLCRYIHPGLTSIVFPDPSPYINICLDWLERGAQQWQGPLLLQPQESEIFEGGSCVSLNEQRSDGASTSE